MSRIAPEEVREIAALARLRLDEAEIQKMAQELDGILGHFESVRTLDTGDAPPMTHAVPFDCPTREDVAEAPLAVDDALRNAPRREGSFFVVPRMLPTSEGGKTPSGEG